MEVTRRVAPRVKLSEGIARGRVKCTEFFQAAAYYTIDGSKLMVDSLGAAHLGFYGSFKPFSGDPKLNAETISRDLARAYWVLGERLSARPKLVKAFADTFKMVLVLDDYKYLSVAGAISRVQEKQEYKEADLVRILQSVGL